MRMPATKMYLLGTRFGGLYSSKNRSSQVSSLFRCGGLLSRGGALGREALRSFLDGQKELSEMNVLRQSNAGFDFGEPVFLRELLLSSQLSLPLWLLAE